MSAAALSRTMFGGSPNSAARVSRVDALAQIDRRKSIAIIVPTFNRPEKIAQLLRHLSRLDGGPYTTFVIDDGGSQPLDGVCGVYPWVRLVRQPNGGPGAARNTGARVAEGFELLAFIDDDCRPHPDWIMHLVEAQGGVPGRLVGGRVDNALPDNLCSSVSQSMCSYLYEYYQASGSELSFFTSNNICCRREDFMAHGGFDEDFPLAAGEDRDFGIRWGQERGGLCYAPNAAVDHSHDLNLSKFWRQHSNYGRGARQLHRVIDRRGNGQAKLERASFYLGMLTYPLRQRARKPVREMVLIGLSQVAMASGYLEAAIFQRSGASS